MHAIIFVFTLYIVATLYAQEIGHTCVFDNTQYGTCKLFSKCRNAKAALLPKVCGFEGNHPIICCSASISEIKCNEWKLLDYVEPPPDKNVVRGWGVGGEDSLMKEFPHMAALGYGKTNEKQWICGGSLISEKFVLTAAHCIQHKILGEVTSVRLGYLKLRSNANSITHQEFEVIRRIKHPSYKASQQYNDIALLELDRAAKFNEYVHPACIQTTKVFEYSHTVTATGWGRVGVHGTLADHLQKLKLAESPHTDCNKFYNQVTRRLPDGIVDESQMCAAGDKQDTCEGDSGGPLQVKPDDYHNVYIIIGVTSFGKACLVSRAPGVYTRVSNYVKWIESVVWEK